MSVSECVTSRADGLAARKPEQGPLRQERTELRVIKGAAHYDEVGGALQLALLYPLDHCGGEGAQDAPRLG